MAGLLSRRPTNVTLDAAMVTEARQLGVNVSKACEQGLAAEIATVRRAAWLAENAGALAASNDFVETHGLPLTHLRRF